MDMNVSKLQEIVEDRSLECFSPWLHMELLNNNNQLYSIKTKSLFRSKLC